MTLEPGMNFPDFVAAIWLVVFNTVTFFAFGFDKWRAGRPARRVSEMTLVGLGALGGWPGGLLGMFLFHHKTVKWTFQLKYALALIPFIAELWFWLQVR
jgi:uncharacterized membrane protein YsdA (DUF1294 family)